MIEVTQGLHRVLKTSSLSFDIDEYYDEIISKCNDFLSESGGSEIPSHMNKIELYYTIPIFTLSSVITVNSEIGLQYYKLKSIGDGSYATVFKYFDTTYNKNFALKRADKTLNTKGFERFEQEFFLMRQCKSPYIVEVYALNKEKNEYTMELMDYTLEKYIKKNNNKISFVSRKNIGYQVIKAFSYLHSKSLLHRDISPKNILIKEYEDTVVVKVADFGLVKNPERQLTSFNTEFKGYFNDPALIVEGFSSYSILHETYALTRLLFYILTGRTNTDNIKNCGYQEFITQGLNVDKTKRFVDCNELGQKFRLLNDTSYLLKS